MTATKLDKSTLKRFLHRAENELCRGERVRIPFTENLHKLYVEYQMKGLFNGLFCMKNTNGFYLTRIR